MPPNFYSAIAARRSLMHFVGGKAVAAALGVGFLLATVRTMAPDDYGRYVAVVAMCEIFYLTSGLGLSTVAQRYVAEYRVQAMAQDFNAFLRKALRRRFVYSVLFGLAVHVFWEPMMRAIGLALAIEWRSIVMLLLVATAGMSFLEEVMGALLLQGYSQALAIARNLVKLSLVLGIILTQAGLSLRGLLYVEAGVALFCWIGAEALVRRWARQAPSSALATPGFHSASMTRVSIRFYAVQLLWTVYSPSMVKLIVTRMLGAAQTAALGVPESITTMLRNYMPAHLLAGWVRSILVARYVANRDLNELSLTTNLILKINLLGLFPALAVSVVMGDQFIAWVTAGRYSNLGTLLALLTGLAMLYSAHLLMSMVLLTLEQAGVGLRATFAAACTLPLLVLALYVVGVEGAAIGMVFGEVVWIGMAWWLLRRQGFVLRFDGAGALKLAAAGLLATAAGGLCMHTQLSMPWWATGAVMAVVYGLAVLALRPASADDIAIVRRLLSARAKPAT